MKGKNLDMTSGDPMRLLTLFTLPALASNLLNQVYTFADSLIVGRYLGQASFNAVGVCMSVILLISAMVIGLNIGMGIIMSQRFGERDFEDMRHTLANAIFMGLLLGGLVGAAGIPAARPILRLMNTPEDSLREAVIYMRISFFATVFPIFYFMFSNVFRDLGDGYTALYCLVVSVIGNVLLDYIFVVYLHLGVAGTAYATAIAQGVSGVFAVMMLWWKYPDMRLGRKDFAPDRRLFTEVTRLAVPIAIQSGFNNPGNVVVQRCVNGFGDAAVAAYTAANRLGTLSLMPMETVGGTLSVYAGQNLGAKEYKRIDGGVWASLKLDAVVSTALGIALLAFGKPLTLLFLPEADGEVLTYSRQYLLYAAVPGFLHGIMYVYQYVQRGVGLAKESMAGSFMQLGAKVIIALAGAYLLSSLRTVWLAWPVSYLAGTVYPFVRYRRYAVQWDAKVHKP